MCEIALVDRHFKKRTEIAPERGPRRVSSWARKKRRLASVLSRSDGRLRRQLWTTQKRWRVTIGGERRVEIDCRAAGKSVTGGINERLRKSQTSAIRSGRRSSI